MPIRVEREPNLIVVTFVGEATDAEFDAYLEQMAKELRATKEPTASILDGSRATGASARQREKQARWMKDNHDLLSTKSTGSAFVISSRIIRGILTAIFWVQKPPGPYVIVETMTEARAWARSQTMRPGARV